MVVTSYIWMAKCQLFLPLIFLMNVFTPVSSLLCICSSSLQSIFQFHMPAPNYSMGYVLCLPVFDNIWHGLTNSTNPLDENFECRWDNSCWSVLDLHHAEISSQWSLHTLKGCGHCPSPVDYCLHPFIDPHGTLCVGGREQNTNMSYSHRHLIILHGKHPIVKLIINSEHLRLLHGGPTLVYSSLSCSFHIVGGWQIVRSMICSCIVCRCLAVKPQLQLMGQLLNASNLYWCSVPLDWTMLALFESTDMYASSKWLRPMCVCLFNHQGHQGQVQGSAPWTSVRPHIWRIHCCTETIHFTPRQTVTSLE